MFLKFVLFYSGRKIAMSEKNYDLSMKTSILFFQAMFSNYESWYLHKLCLPSLAIIPPILVAMTTENIEILVCINFC
jgi:hypothetical protein